MDWLLNRLETLDYYDGPELLLAQDQFEGRHLVYFCETTDKGTEVFYSTLISPHRLESLRAGATSVREVFEAPEVPLFLRMELTGQEVGPIHASPAAFQRFPEELLPSPDYRPDCSGQTALANAARGSSPGQQSGVKA